MITLSAIHWVYLIFIGLILLSVILKKDISIICIIGILSIAFMNNFSISESIMSVFNGFLYAIKELLPIILIISVITALSNLLSATGINEVMISPLAKLIKNKVLAYWIIGISMMIISWFFWPSPAVALIGAILVPVAAKAGLPKLGAAIAMNIFGHGIALSSDIIIQGAPKITCDAAGIAINKFMPSIIILELVMGFTTSILAFYFIMKDIKNNNLNSTSDNLDLEEDFKEDFKDNISKTKKNFLAFLVLFSYALDVAFMFLLSIKGENATSLIGGTTLFLLLIIFLSIFKDIKKTQLTSYLIDGFQFAFKVFGAVIPIATFFYLGGSGFEQIIGNPLTSASEGIINDLGIALSNAVPLNKIIATFTVSGVGILTGLDGSGFSGLSLVGSSTRLFSSSLSLNSSPLAALGQICTIWIGGGTLIPWALIPVAAVCKVSPFELARKNFLPVTIGLITTMLFALVFLI
ncbi:MULTISPECIES: hypothetical protein [unclassified Clostridium]|uniref:hypothetical protein n=1 Tax=unclassified Clostridium TaxID=2614128 RepID=UPI001D841AF7|nr:MULTISPECIES: hypothetical protein [unclassified Clostridium]MBN1046480.1 hypothetical protein [Clostridium botulinum]